MGKLVVRYEIEAEKMPDNCNECPVARFYFERCPCDVWYYKRGDMPMLYSKFNKKRHKDCPLTFVEGGSL